MFFVCFLFVSYFALQAQEIPIQKESVFKPGEELRYKLRYGFITAAEATLKVQSSAVKFDNRPVYHLVAQGKTSGTFDIFYKVRNRYDSYIDQTYLTPHLYTENIRESDYRRNDKARFLSGPKKVVSNKGTFEGDGQTFDIVSAYYFARNIDLTNIKPGDKFTMDYFLTDEITTLGVSYVGKERVKTSLGTFNCLKFSPAIYPGRIFKKTANYICG